MFFLPFYCLLFEGSILTSAIYCVDVYLISLGSLVAGALFHISQVSNSECFLSFPVCYFANIEPMYSQGKT